MGLLRLIEIQGESSHLALNKVVFLFSVLVFFPFFFSNLCSVWGKMYLSTEMLRSQPCCCCVPSSNVALGEAPFPLGGCHRGWPPVQSSSSTFLLTPDPPRCCGSSWADVESDAAWAALVLHVRERY